MLVGKGIIRRRLEEGVLGGVRSRTWDGTSSIAVNLDCTQGERWVLGPLLDQLNQSLGMGPRLIFQKLP